MIESTEKKYDEPLVSVIIPTYKRSEMLPRTVDSVLSQTYKKIQVIVVDDNNPDTSWRKETENRMSQYLDNPNVFYIKHSHNKNGSAARNTGWKFSSGQLICFLDDDDFYYPNKVASQVKILQSNPESSGCWCDYRKNGKEIRLDENADIIYNILMGEDTPQTSGWMIRREALEKINGFDETYFRHQDYEFLLRFFRSNFKLIKDNEILYQRDVSETDNTPSGEKMEFIKKKLFSEFHDFIEICELKYNNFEKKLYISSNISIFKCYFKEKKWKDCIRILKKSFNISRKYTTQMLIDTIKSHF